MELEVEKILKQKGIPYRLIALSGKAVSVEDVTKLSKDGINADEICKTIILKGRKTGKLVAILLQGTDRVNSSKLRKLLKEDVAIASPAEVMEAAGVEPGAVCPFLLKVPLYVDAKVALKQRINCGSGDHLYGLEFNFDDLKKGIAYENIEVSK